MPSLIDELPLLVLLASFAHGMTTIRGAGELRVKESDRIATRGRGAERPSAPTSRRWTTASRCAACRPGCAAATIDAAGDHRIAMLGAMAGALFAEGVTIEGAEALAVSFPDFAERLAAVSG